MSDPSSAAAAAAAEEAMKELFDAIHNILLSKYTYVVAATLMFWDIMLTFDQEVDRVWKAKSSLGRNLFLVNRYVPPILFICDLIFQLSPHPTIQYCKQYFLPSAILGIFALTNVQFVLVLRTYAIYQSKILLGVLVSLCVISGATMIASTVYLFRHDISWLPSGTLPTVVGCTSSCSSPLCRTLLTAFWIPFFVLETTIFLLTLYKSVTSFSRVGIKHTSRFVTVVYRDGLIYYMVIMTISVANLVVWVATPLSLSYIATSLMRSLQVTICSRLLLNIRGMLEPQYATQGTLVSVPHYEDSRIKYEERPTFASNPAASVDEGTYIASISASRRQRSSFDYEHGVATTVYGGSSQEHLPSSVNKSEKVVYYTRDSESLSMHNIPPHHSGREAKRPRIDIEYDGRRPSRD